MASKNFVDFNWLEDQIKAVKTNNFFIVDSPASKSLQKRIESSPLGVPSSYKSFAIQFGNAKLYRSREQYLVEVFASPHEAEPLDDDLLLAFGKTDESPAYFRASELRDDGAEIPVYEWNPEDGLHQAYLGFESWLVENCRIARRQFSKKRWADIENGPRPFSIGELNIIQARGCFKWQIAGVSDDGDLLLDITNDSNTVLPYLTIGVRGKKIGLGAIFVPVAQIQPGEHKVVKVNCYKDVEPPKLVELFQKPDPVPENRDRYWEFKPLIKNKPIDGGR